MGTENQGEIKGRQKKNERILKKRETGAGEKGREMKLEESEGSIMKQNTA